MDARISYFPNGFPSLKTLPRAPRDYLVESVTVLAIQCPPTKAAGLDRVGFYSGPTSIAYLLFHLAKTHGHLKVNGSTFSELFEEYLQCGPRPRQDIKTYGVMNEYLCWNALNAAHTNNACEFLDAVDGIEFGEAQEILVGSAGLLVLLRFVKDFVPEAKDDVDKRIKSVVERINGSSWLYADREFTGAAHGNIGIITQVCLSGYASTVRGRLLEFLDLQNEDGNWYSTTSRKHEHMQWCHGVVGCVISLLAIEKYFPDLEERTNTAIRKAQDLIIKQGVITKAPCLCHGVTGNALALHGEQRDHLLTYATSEMRTQLDWEPSTDLYGLYCGEAGNAWVWAMLDGGRKGFPAYSDIWINIPIAFEFTS